MLAVDGATPNLPAAVLIFEPPLRGAAATTARIRHLAAGAAVVPLGWQYLARSDTIELLSGALDTLLPFLFLCENGDWPEK